MMMILSPSRQSRVERRIESGLVQIDLREKEVEGNR